MVKKPKSNETKGRSVVGRERRLALALCAVLDTFTGDKTSLTADQMDALESGHALLAETGYGDLESIPLRVNRLNEQLEAAFQSGNGKEIARLGLELDRTKAGLPPSKPKGEQVKAVGGE